MELGRFDNITLDQYHNEYEGWSKSSLDLVDKSMAHYLYNKAQPQEQTPAMLLGSAFHSAVLTPSEFENEYCVAPACDKRTKAGKELWAEFCTENADKTVISAGDMENIRAMKEAVYSHPMASILFLKGDAEHSFFWKHKATDLLCKCRPDYLRHDGTVIDLKTCDSADYDNFQRTVVKYRYHVQGAFFLDGISAVLNEKLTDFVLVAVEKTPPYNVACYRLWDDAIETGRQHYERNLRSIVEYEKNPEADRWAGYPVEIQDLFLPAWA